MELLLDFSPETLHRLELLAAQMGQSVPDCTRLALREFIDNWEEHLRRMAALSEEEDGRPHLGKFAK